MKKLLLSTGVVIILFSFVLFPITVFANNNAEPVNSSISVSSGSIPADGLTTATISVIVKDSEKNTLSGDHVTLTNASGDTGVVINGGAVGATDYTAATNSNGNVTFTVKSNNPSPGTDTFTVTDISNNPNITLGSISITFTASALAPNSSCTDGAPGSTPQLTSVVPNGLNKITLTWTDATDPVSGYLIAYGTASGQYIYGNPNVGGQGTTSYTVGSLADGTIYYFVVRAVNGCNPGSYSNEVSAIAGGIPTPTPTQTDTSNSSSNSNSDNSQQNIDNSTVQDTPTAIPTPQPTESPTPTPAQTFMNGMSINKIIIYSFLFVIILSFAGIFYWWKFKNNKKKTDINSY